MTPLWVSPCVYHRFHEAEKMQICVQHGHDYEYKAKNNMNIDFIRVRLFIRNL